MVTRGQSVHVQYHNVGGPRDPEETYYGIFPSEARFRIDPDTFTRTFESSEARAQLGDYYLRIEYRAGALNLVVKTEAKDMKAQELAGAREWIITNAPTHFVPDE